MTMVITQHKNHVWRRCVGQPAFYLMQNLTGQKAAVAFLYLRATGWRDMTQIPYRHQEASDTTTTHI